MATWQNADGLSVRFGQDQARETSGMLGKASTTGPVEYMVVDLDWDKLPGPTTDLNNDGTANGYSDQDAYIPLGAYITAAWISTETTFAAAGAATLDLGFKDIAGNVLDLDAIDAVLSIAQLTATAGVNCNGADVGGVLNAAIDSYVYSTVTTGPYTAGKAKLVIQYIQLNS
jgi:hypothetical protein